MLKKCARNATAAANPVSINGVARVSVSPIAKRDPNAPSKRMKYARPTGAPAHTISAAHSSSVNTIAPTGAAIVTASGVCVRCSQRMLLAGLSGWFSSDHDVDLSDISPHPPPDLPLERGGTVCQHLPLVTFSLSQGH